MPKIIRHALKKTGITSVVSVGCVHLGKEDKPGMAILYNYLADNAPDVFVSGGDLTDATEFRRSSTPKTYIDTQKAIDKDFDLTRKFQDTLYETCPDADLYAIRGNHEYRYERAAKEMEFFEPQLNFEKYKDYWLGSFTHIKDYDGGEEFHIGTARMIHGRYYGKNHLQKHYDCYGANTFYWHTHEKSEMRCVKNTETNAPMVASLGCMEKILPDWMSGRPHKWVNCFQQWYFEPNGKFNMYNICINGKTAIAPGGKAYRA